MSDYLFFMAKRALKAEAEEQFFPIEYLDINLSDSQNPYNINENSFLIEYPEISSGFQGPHFDTVKLASSIWRSLLLANNSERQMELASLTDTDENSFLSSHPDISLGFQEPHVDVNTNSPASLDNLPLINLIGLMQADWKPDYKRLKSS